MIEIKAKLKAARAAYMVEVKGRLPLPFAARQQRGLKAKLDSGEEVVLNLPRGEVLRGGDLVTASDGRVIEVVAKTEKLLHVECKRPADLARIAYDLGNRHVPVLVGDGFLRLAAEPALAEALKKKGATVSEVEVPFEPDAVGAHEHAAEGHGGEAHGHGHPHHHGHHHGHEHKH
ncbi:MAG: urease accessory protein UreE [Betaproteobacteria bacterium]|nr:urease accessory protein UreE [Betaproteobacteria bacterium]